MSEISTFSCGCTVPIKNGVLDIYIYDVPLTCPRVWQFIQTGNTKMGFQIESELLSTWAKQVRPSNIDELAALISAVRPGVLHSVDEAGISMAKHYALRKNGEEEVTSLDPCLEPYLSDTFQVMLYQEQMLAIAQHIAGMNAVEADNLRKGVGKKKADILFQCQKTFVDGCERIGKLSREKAEQFFEVIKKSARYLFVRAHAVSYAYQAYYSMWCKAHRVKEAFGSWLYHSNFSQNPKDEIRELINHSITQKVKVDLPDLRDLEPHFYIKDTVVKYGLVDISGIGSSIYQKIVKVVSEIESKLGKSLKEWTFYEFLIHFTSNVVKTAVEALISSGAVDHFNLDRTYMLDQYSKFSELSKPNLTYVDAHWTEYDNLENLIIGMARSKKNGGACHNVRTLEKMKGIINRLQNPSHSLSDSLTWKCNIEEKLLGATISVNRVANTPEGIDITSCTDVKRLDRSNFTLAVEVIRSHVIKCKRGESAGRNMAFLTVKDNSGILTDITVFSNTFSEYESLLTVGNTVMLFGYKDKRKKGFIVQKACQI